MRWVMPMVAVLVAGGVALAQTATPAMDEYKTAMMKMHDGMSLPSSGDADIDFVRMMIPHHQAAVDMAKTQLKYGKDPQIRRLTQAIIVAQEKEIAEMNAWLAARKK